MKHTIVFTLSLLLCTSLFAQYRVEVAVYGEPVQEDYFLQFGIRDMNVEKDFNDLFRYFYTAENIETASTLLDESKTLGFKYAKIIDLKKQQQQCINACAPTPLLLDSRSFKKMINFAFDQARLSAFAQSELETVTSILRQHKNFNVRLVGHTDAVGTAQYNIGLASRRAMASKNYLISKGIDPHRIKIKVYGESNPVAINRDLNGKDVPQGRKFNRRVEIDLVDLEDQQVEKWTEIVSIPNHLKITPQGLHQLSKPDPKTE